MPDEGTSGAGAATIADQSGGTTSTQGVGSEQTQGGSNQSGLAHEGFSAKFTLAGDGSGAPSLKDLNAQFASHIPESFREKEWVKNILANPEKDYRTELFTQFENAQKLIGQKQTGVQIPGDDAPPEAVKAFHKALGVPDSPDGYDVKPMEFGEADKAYGEYLQTARPDGFMADIKQAAIEAGVTPKQLQALLNAHDTAFMKHHKEFIAAQVQAEQEQIIDFDALADKTFGADKNRAIENAKKLISDCLPADSPWRVAIARLGDASAQITPNEAAIMLAAFAHGFRNKYIREDGGVRGGSTVTGGSADPMKEVRALMENKAYFDPMNPEHKSVRNQVAELMKQAKELGKI